MRDKHVQLKSVLSPRGRSNRKVLSKMATRTVPGTATPRQNEREPEHERDLIDMMNELQSKLVANGYSLDIPLPQIVVVGSQSAERKQFPRTSSEG
ncbi:hypothetical protein CEXT_361991, partial [Caerostris extrusa]